MPDVLITGRHSKSGECPLRTTPVQARLIFSSAPELVTEHVELPAENFKDNEVRNDVTCHTRRHIKAMQYVAGVTSSHAPPHLEGCIATVHVRLKTNAHKAYYNPRRP